VAECRIGGGRRVYIRQRYRLHHGAVGAALVVIGILLMADDRADFPWGFLEEIAHDVHTMR
jgi:hypothetical protein